MAERTDEQLLLAYREGESGAFRALIERHQDALLRFLIRFMGDAAAADDVFQEAFLQVHLSADTFDVDRRFKPWLFTIAANKGRDHLRKHNRRPVVDLSAPVDSSGEDDGGRTFLDLMEVDVEAPGARLEDRERDRLVQRAVDAMPDHLREVLLLAYFQRLSYQAIADNLEIPLGTVKSRLHAAVASFAKHWAAQSKRLDEGEAAAARPRPPGAGAPKSPDAIARIGPSGDATPPPDKPDARPTRRNGPALGGSDR